MINPRIVVKPLPAPDGAKAAELVAIWPGTGLDSPLSVPLVRPREPDPLARLAALQSEERDLVASKTREAARYGAACWQRDPDAAERREAAMRANMALWARLREVQEKVKEMVEGILKGGRQAW